MYVVCTICIYIYIHIHIYIYDQRRDAGAAAGRRVRGGQRCDAGVVEGRQRSRWRLCVCV